MKLNQVKVNGGPKVIKLFQIREEVFDKQLGLEEGEVVVEYPSVGELCPEFFKVDEPKIDIEELIPSDD